MVPQRIAVSNGVNTSGRHYRKGAFILLHCKAAQVTTLCVRLKCPFLLQQARDPDPRTTLTERKRGNLELTSSREQDVTHKSAHPARAIRTGSGAGGLYPPPPPPPPPPRLASSRSRVGFGGGGFTLGKCPNLGTCWGENMVLRAQIATGRKGHVTSIWPFEVPA